MLDSVEANVTVLGDDLSSLNGVTATDHKRMEHFSASIDVLELDMKRFNSSMALVMHDNLSKYVDCVTAEI